MTSTLARQTAIVLVEKLVQTRLQTLDEFISSGYTVPESWTSSLPRAIAFCDQCAAQIPELTKTDVIFSQLPKSTKQKIEKTLIQIIQQLDQEFPEPEEE